MDKAKCPHCGSDDVSQCFPVWIPVKDPDDRAKWEPDCEADPLWDGVTVCNSCDESWDGPSSGFLDEDEDEDEEYCCEGCGRPEDECSRYPCEDVIAERESY